MFDVFYHTLSDIDSSHRYVTLDGIPSGLSNHVALDVIGGTAQYQYQWHLGDISGDFNVLGSTIIWNSHDYALYDELAADDKIRVIYDRS